MFCAWVKGIWDPYSMVFDAALVNSDSPDFKNVLNFKSGLNVL